MLMPKRVKRRKQFRGSMAGKAMRGNTISQGEYRTCSTGALLDQIQPDRGSPCCYDPLHQNVVVKFGSRFSRTSL